MSAVDKATLDIRVEQTVSQFNAYGNHRRNAEIFQLTHKPPTCYQRVRQEDPSRLTDPRHLELIVDKTWDDALTFNVSKMIGITTTPVGGSTNEVHQQLHPNLDKFPSTLTISNDEMMMKELKNHLKVDMESPALGMIVGSSTVNYQDVPVSDFRICDRLRESISSFFEKDEEPYRSMIQQSKSEWKDACHKRSIGDVETLLNTHIRPDYHFNPLNSSNETYHEISPSITSEATLSPNKLESMITIASQEAEKQEVDMNTRADTTPSSVHASVLASNRCHWNDGREKYTSNLKSVVSKVVDDQSHLSSEKWSSQGNLLPCVYPMKLNNKGGETYNRSTREHFGSMDVPPTVQFWRSKGDSVRDGTENETFLPNGDDLEIRMKLAKINSIASESKRSEWNV